jgi:hypothetical protein
MILLQWLSGDAYGAGMRVGIILIFCLAGLFSGRIWAQGQPPRENPYDVIGKMFQPLWGVFLSESVGANRAMVLTMDWGGEEALLPSAGETVRLAVQFPDKVRLEAPVLGEKVVVCRDGDRVWAVPGAKIEYLMKKFGVVPRRAAKSGTPIPLPITAQQAIFLPALFTVERPDVAEVEEIDGVPHRVLTAGLMPELARVVKAENFRARVWVGSNYSPRRIELRSGNFNGVVNVREMVFSRELPASTWARPAGEDIYSTNSDMLEGLLSAVMNSVQALPPRVGAR